MVYMETVKNLTKLISSYITYREALKKTTAKVLSALIVYHFLTKSLIIQFT